MSSYGKRRVLRQRRARRAKLRKLRRRYLAAATEDNQKKILEKVRRLAPTVSPNEFLARLTKMIASPKTGTQA